MRAKRESSSTPFLVLLIIRALGIIVLLVGLVTAIKVLERSWGLLGEHTTVVELSESIDKQSGLHAFFGKSAAQLSGLMGVNRDATARAPGGATQPTTADTVSAAAQTRGAPSLRASYFMAWPLSILVLFLVARIALALIMTGANLALKTASGDEQIRALVNELVNEIRASRDEPLRRQ